MKNIKSYCYCEKCFKPIYEQPDPEPRYSICPECAMRLYQKIFLGNQEADKQ